MMVTGFKDDGTILFSAHSNDRINQPITEDYLEDDTVLIEKTIHKKLYNYMVK